ncbi:MAG: DNA polymerase III subunit alpha [Oscillospiraceae bacterium]|jgi:DNA polymerase-3 subunit alpha|nr:DNA polymerase III subunit alpha [Oscillospiraceae bacterium]
MAFTHLHLHTEYSLLDGACRIEQLVQRVKALGQTSVAITDHGVMYGVIDFYRACKAAGVKPIIGCEVYVAPRTRFDRVHELDGSARHLVLLCRNEEGYRNLSYMVSMAFTEGFYIKPRIDMDLLRAHSKGLVALSACLAGEIPRRLRNGDYEGAKAHALEMRELFGEDGYYLEIQDHRIPEQQAVIAGIMRLSRETGIPMVATNDCHYLTREDAAMQDVLMCVQMGKLVEDADRMRFETDEFYVKSEEEMRALFPNCPEAIDNTQRVADLCHVEFEFGKYHLPEFRLPQGETDGDAYFEKLCWKGFEQRYPSGGPELKDRLSYEMGVIRQMGFVDYFLIVSDFIGYAKGHGIPVGPGRGSGAGSMVAYCLRITDVDPIKYGLIFERFLNPERVTMPDIDIDFCIRRRQEVIDYVSRKYGEDHVVQIVTFGTMKAKAAIRDVGRVLNFPYAEVDNIAKQVPFELKMTLDKALVLSKGLSDLYNGDERVKELVDMARKIEGMPRNASTHAAGVVITKRPVYEYVPLATNDGQPVTQYTMTTIEELGLLKMDFLGLRNLTVLDDAVKMVQKEIPGFKLEDIPDDDMAVYQMLSEGKTSGVFQMESAGMTGVGVGLKPKSIEDICAIIALYRPGPMDSIPRFLACAQDPTKVTYKHPLLEPILSNTYGCIVYQEQVIEIFRKLAGYSLGQADMVRRAMSKKKEKDVQRERQSFIHGDPKRGIPGCQANGIPAAVAESIYDEINDFAHYAFNKSHSLAYAIVAYQTAWFKCRHPREYMAALLTSVLDSQDKVAEYISECRENGIALLPPDINESETAFTVSGENIRFGLAALKGVGAGFTAAVLAERDKGGPFRSFQEFCARMYDAELNKRVLDSLIRSGCFDSLGCRRSQLMKVHEQVVDAIARDRKKNLEGQFDLFGGGGDSLSVPTVLLPDIPEFSPVELMSMEKETTGLYLSGHPMDEYRKEAVKFGAVPISAVMAAGEEDRASPWGDGQRVTLAGVVASVRTKTTKNNTLMAYVMLEDATGAMELLCFSRTLTESGAYLKANLPVVVTGRVSIRDEKAPQLMVDQVIPLSGARKLPVAAGENQALWIKLPDGGERFTWLKTLLSMFPGEAPVIVYLADQRRKLQTHCLHHEALLDELRETLGEKNVVLKERN